MQRRSSNEAFTGRLTTAGKIYSAALAAIGLSAITLQCYWGVLAGMRDGASLFTAAVNVLSYFTILTNILVAVTLISSLAANRAAALSPQVKTAVLSYIVVVGLVYEAVLRKLWDPQGLHRVVDTVLHDAVPLGFLIFWLVFVPRGFVSYSAVWRWTVYPLGYLIYSTIRGSATGFFPYPFIDFPQIGLGRWFVNVVVMVVLFVGIGALLITLDKALARSARGKIAGLRNQLS